MDESHQTQDFGIKLEQFEKHFRSGPNIIETVKVNQDYLAKFVADAEVIVKSAKLQIPAEGLAPDIAIYQEDGPHTGCLVLGLQMDGYPSIWMPVPAGYWMFAQ